MLLLGFAPKALGNTWITLGALLNAAVLMTVILFRDQIFRKRAVKRANQPHRVNSLTASSGRTQKNDARHGWIAYKGLKVSLLKIGKISGDGGVHAVIDELCSFSPRTPF